MDSKQQLKYCCKCKSCREVNANGGFRFLGCYYDEYKGKWVAEIEKCPKEEALKLGVGSK